LQAARRPADACEHPAYAGHGKAPSGEKLAS
jgi:hypothetical protein